VRLTEVVARWRGGEAARCGGARRRPHRREGRWRLRLAPGAAREDEGGEGGSKSGNGGGLVGLSIGGGDGDDDGRKHAEMGHGGSVASVDERWLAWPCGRLF
jgi:hypothetical protein